MRVVELFCGAGGMSLGLKRAGFTIQLAFDHWQAALKVYRANMPKARTYSFDRRPHHARAADISDLMILAPQIAMERPDIIVGGPPCQDFSTAGQRIEGTRADMTLAFAMLVIVSRPEWFVMENVPEAATSQAWSKARTLLKRAGYGMTLEVLDASFYGVPQSRRRLIAVGRLGEADGFLSSALRDAAAKRPMTMRDAFGDQIGERFYVHPRSTERRGIYSADEPSPTVRSASGRRMPPTYRGHAADAQPHADQALGPDEVREVRLVYSRAYGDGRCVRTIDEPYPGIIRTSRDRPTRTQIETQRPDELAPIERVPPLTVEQMSRIQGFPEGWMWSWDGKGETDPNERENARNRDQMIANAVPAPLAEAIGKVVLARHRGETVPALDPRFRVWLRRKKKLEGGVLRNRLAQLNRARRLLNGRIISDIVVELATLDSVLEFEKLSRPVQSDLRAALRLHAEWRMASRPRVRNEYVHDPDWASNQDPEPPIPPSFLAKLTAIRAAKSADASMERD